MNAPDLARPRPSLRWPLIVIGLLLGHIALMAAAVTLAVRDTSNTVIPDYYQRAVNWDQTHATPHPVEARP